MTTHTPGETPSDRLARLAAWAAMNGPEILTDTVEAHGALLTRLTTDVAAAREEVAEVGLGLGQAVGASMRAHEESSAHSGNVGDWLQGLDEQVSQLRGQLSELRGELERLRGRIDDVEYRAAAR